MSRRINKREQRGIDQFVVIGAGFAEQYYFKYLNDLPDYTFIVRPSNFGNETSFQRMGKKVEAALASGSKALCVFDLDTAYNDKSVMKNYNDFVNSYKTNNKVIICENYPCIEFWFLLHFESCNKSLQNCQQAIQELHRYITDYDERKSEDYYKNHKWFDQLMANDGIINAIANSKGIKETGKPFSYVFKALE
jgi:hypothetical protein